MPPTPPDKNPLQLIDRLAHAIVGALHKILGMAWAKEGEGLDYYLYQKTFTTGTADPAGTTYTDSLRISSDASFILQKISCNARNDSSTTAAANRGVLVGSTAIPAAAPTVEGIPDAPFAITLTDGGNDRQYSNEPIDAGLAFGTFGSGPGFQGKARFLRPNSNVQMTLRLFKTVPAAVVWNLRVLFIGVKVYAAQGLDLTQRRF
jgi:hypothetical protein